MQPDRDCLEELKVFSHAIDVSIDGIIIGDLSGKINYVNGALLKMYGATDKAEVVGKYVVELIAERDRERATQKSFKVLESGKGFVGEFAALTKSGDEIPIECTTTIINDQTGKEIGFIDIVRDISERKRAEVALKESEQNYHLLFSNMMDGFAHCKIILDENGNPQDFLFLESK